MDHSSNKFIYTMLQVSKYPSSHLMVAGWYLDCSGGFIPTSKEALHQSLIEMAPVEIKEPKEPQKQLSPQKKNKKVEKGTKGKKADKGKRDK